MLFDTDVHFTIAHSKNPSKGIIQLHFLFVENCGLNKLLALMLLQLVITSEQNQGKMAVNKSSHSYKTYLHLYIMYKHK